MPSLTILKELDPNIEDKDPVLFNYLTEIEGRELWRLIPIIDKKRKSGEGRERLYVVNGMPRNWEWTDAIMALGIGYTVVDDDWMPVGDFNDLAKAEAAVKGATFKLDVKVDLEPPKKTLADYQNMVVSGNT